MPRCVNHPGRPGTTFFAGDNYCAQCSKGMSEARAKVDRHVEPKECFIWYIGHDTWKPITGTGCAHWVSHQLGISTGTPGARCLGGLTYRVPLLANGRTAIADLAAVQVNDIWMSPAKDHCGLVIAVTPAAEEGGPPAITIRHDSSRQGKVAENEYATYFHAEGTFYR